MREEHCPHCDMSFGTDDGSYLTPGRVECPACGADFDAKHDTELETQNESADFDKFMGRILQEEGGVKRIPVFPDSPQRLRITRHQERPLGRTRMRFSQ